MASPVKNAEREILITELIRKIKDNPERIDLKLKLSILVSKKKQE